MEFATQDTFENLQNSMMLPAGTDPPLVISLSHKSNIALVEERMASCKTLLEVEIDLKLFCVKDVYVNLRHTLTAQIRVGLRVIVRRGE